MKNSAKNRSFLISIIIPMYNEEKTIGKCIESLLRQSYPPDKYEIIVVSDGCNDNSEKIVNDLIKSESPVKIKLLRQENQGAAAARNYGAKLAKGAIILFIDADCIADYHWVEEMTKPILTDNVVGVQGAYKTIQKEVIAKLAQIEFEERFRKQQRTEHLDFVGSFSAAYNKDIFEKYQGFKKEFIMNEDVELAFRISSDNYKLYFNPEAYVYHLHPNSLLQYFRTKFWRGFWRIILYRKFRNKTIKDSYTPLSLKIQVSLVFLIAFIMLTSLIIKDLFILNLWLISINMISMTRFILSAMKKNIVLGLYSIFFLWVRAFALASGVFYAFIWLFSKKNSYIYHHKENVQD
ncbi:MAG: glycosyltransferase [Nitrospirae bacterium]|nr:glycosyltransferase [Nitrospirota bacterium]